MSKFFAPIVVGIIFVMSACGAAPADAAPQYTNLNAGTTQPAEWVTAPSATPQVIDPKVIGKAVDANKARAAQDWNGKLVQVTSMVTDISTAFSPSVSFGNVTGQSFSLIQIVCYPAAESDLIPFSKGEKATVRGVVEVGYMGVIKLNDCQKV
jgi:hypothetical protein